MSDPLQPHHLRRVRDISDTSVHRDDLEDDQKSIIDVFDFDDTTDDRWLCSFGSRSSSSSENKIEDLDAWLHAEISENEVSNFENGSRRPIDTRTFVRIKRRSAKLNFENTENPLSPEAKPPSLSNVWKKQTISDLHSQNASVEKEETITSVERKDSVPMMLRPKSNQVLSALLSESPSSISSQTSMEAFKNLAQSKEGLNSLLSDISDPDISSILMNISQPSLLYTSIINDDRGEDTEQNLKGSSLIDSQILTDSMMETSMFKEVQDPRLLSDFLKQDQPSLESDSFYKNSESLDSDEKTFTYNSLDPDETLLTAESNHKKISKTQKNSNVMDVTQTLPSKENSLNSTRTVSNIGSSLNSTRTLSSQENSLNATQIISKAPTELNTSKFKRDSLNSTQIISKTSPLNSTENLYSCNNKFELQNNKDILSATQIIDVDNKTDLTFEINTNQFDETFPSSNFQSNQIATPINSDENGRNSLDATYDAIPSLRQQLLQEVQKSNDNKLDYTFTRTNENKKSEITNATFTSNYTSSTSPCETTNLQRKVDPKKCLNETFKMQVSPKKANVNDYQQTSPLAKQKSSESPDNLLEQNRFNTFKKDSKMNSYLVKASVPQENQLNQTITKEPQLITSNTKNNNNLYQQRFNTFSKKSSIFQKQNMEKTESVEKFVKPKQIQPPRTLSRLPGLFQKSNPNLGSNTKLLGRVSMDSNIGFHKGSQPNISSNVNSLGRFKSEQRLMNLKHNPEFSSGDATSHSMESLGSTESAHSAPDLDDGSSMNSDNSKASYTIKPRNLELQKIINEEKIERKFSGSTPRAKVNQILENTWVEEKNLPSPILKNSSDIYGSGSISTSPTDSSEYTAKTSSPLSPAHSDDKINTILGNNYGCIEATKENIQIAENMKVKQLKNSGAVSSVKNATRQLRPPSSWTGASNKVTNGAASGIPRPASRIPAPRFARPNPK